MQAAYVLLLILAILLSWFIAAEFFREVVAKAFKGVVLTANRPANPAGELDYAPPENKSAWLQRRLWLPAGISVMLVLLIWAPKVLIATAVRSSLPDLLFPAMWLVIPACMLVATIGAIVIVRRGLRRNEHLIPVAATWPRGRLWAGIGCIVAAMLVTIILMDRAVNRALDAQRVKAQAMMAEMTAERGDADAGAIYVAAEAIYTSSATGTEWLNSGPASRRALPDELAPVVEKAHAAAAAEHVDFGIDRTASPLLSPYPHLARMRQVSTIVAGHAIDRARDGDWEAAMSDVRVLRAMSRQVSDGASLVEQLVALGIEQLAVAKAGECLSFAKSEADLAKVPLPDEAWYRHWAEHAMRGDEATSRWLLADVLQGRLGGATAAVPFVFGVRMLLGPAELRDIDALYAELHQAAGRVSQETIADPLVKRARMRGVYISMMAPSTGRSLEHAVECRAAGENLGLAIAATRYRLRTGTLPPSLQALVEAGLIERVPTDPWDGKPWKFLNKGDHVIIYSVGRDRQDDGGVGDRPLKGVDTLMRVSHRPIWEFEPQSEVEPGSDFTGTE